MIMEECVRQEGRHVPSKKPEKISGAERMSSSKRLKPQNWKRTLLGVE